MNREAVDSKRMDADRAIQILTKATGLIGASAFGLGHLVTAAAGEGRVVLVVDQFEEVFTQCKHDSERQQFFECLLGTLDRKDYQICLVLVMRADFFGKCAEKEYAGLASKIQEHLVTVTPMTPEQLEQAITEPAQQVGLEVERELVKQMLRDVEGPGSLPLLQYTLRELWRQRLVNRLTLSEYTRLGGVKETLQRRADEVYQKSLTAEEQQVAKRIFLDLTQLGEGTEDTRRQVLKSDLVTAQQSEVLVDRVLQKLVDARLVVTSELKARGESDKTVTVVDVAHEALIRHWHQLRQWVDENREALRIERKIEAAAQEWESQGKPAETAYLLQGPRLAEAESYLQDYSDLGLLSNLSLKFIQLSQNVRDRILREEEERTQRELDLLRERNRLLREEEEGRQRELQLIREALEQAEKASQQERQALEQEKKASEQERKARKAAQTRNRILIAAVVVVSTAGVGILFALNQATQRQISALNALSESQLANHAQLEALRASIEAAKRLKQTAWVDNHLRVQTAATLQQAVYETQERNRLEWHKDAVNSVSFSPDGKLLASGSEDNTLILWRKDDTEPKILQRDSGRVSCVTFSTDGKLLASASEDTQGTTIKLWHSDGTLLRTFKKESYAVNSISLSPDNKTLASASSDGTVRLWGLDGTLHKTFKAHSAGVKQVSFSPDGKMLASGSDDKTIKLWNTKGSPIKTLRGHTDYVTSISFSPVSTDDTILASASLDKTVRLWKRDGSAIAIPDHSSSVNTIRFSPDGKTLAFGSDDKTVKLWSRDGELVVTLEGHNDKITSLSFSKDGKTLASASIDKTIRLWSLENTRHRYKNEIYSASFSPDGITLAVAECDGTIQLWHRNDWVASREPFKTFKGHSDCINSLSFSPDGKKLASASDDKTMKLWIVENGALLKTLAKHSEAVSSVSFNPDGKMLASASEDKTIALWTVEDGKLHQSLTGHSDRVSSVRFSPDGRTLVSASYDKTIKLWPLEGKPPKTLGTHDGEIAAVSFSPDGKTLASGSWDGTINLWNVKKGKQTTTLIGHTDQIAGVSFSPDSKTLASSSADGTIKLWSVTEGTLIKTLRGHQTDVLSVNFSPEGKALLTTSSGLNPTVILWNLDLDNLLKRGCTSLRDYQTNPNLKESDRHLCDNP
jgi:WD40 repeat protein